MLSRIRKGGLVSKINFSYNTMSFNMVYIPNNLIIFINTFLIYYFIVIGCIYKIVNKNCFIAHKFGTSEFEVSFQNMLEKFIITSAIVVVSTSYLEHLIIIFLLEILKSSYINV